MPTLRLLAVAAGTVLLAACTGDTGKRLSFNVLQQQECQRISDPEQRAGCNRSYDREYDRYQGERERMTSGSATGTAEPSR